MERETTVREYVLPERNIIELGANSDFFKKLPRALRELPWPAEVQGSGLTIPESRELKIYYPSGDVFLSAAVIIHETGHWRQVEIDSNLDPNQVSSRSDHFTANLRAEEDAWKRGWERCRRYAPEHLAELESQLAAARKTGKMKRAASFRDVYKQLRQAGMVINRLYHDFGASEEPRLKRRLQQRGTALKGAALERRLKEGAGEFIASGIKARSEIDFFQNVNDWRVGRAIDTTWARKFIQTVARRVATERC